MRAHRGIRFRQGTVVLWPLTPAAITADLSSVSAAEMAGTQVRSLLAEAGREASPDLPSRDLSGLDLADLDKAENLETALSD